jgi:hypothetical protein
MITGGIKFFEQSYCLFKNGATATASSNNSAINTILNYDKDNGWVSSGSAEDTIETITITLPTSTTFSRMFLLNHNFSFYDIYYGNYQNFSNVITLTLPYGIGNYTDESGAFYTDENGLYYNDGENEVTAIGNAISQSGYTVNASYYEFDAVTTNTIIIQAKNVQDPATIVEKFLGSFIITDEIGTFSVDGLALPNASVNANNRVERNLNNKAIVQRGVDTFSCSLNSQYLYNQDDLDLYTNLFDRNDDFLVWLCGGRYGTPYFRVNAKPYRPLDVFRVRNVGDLDNNYYKNLYNAGMAGTLNLIEVEG